MFDKLTVFAAMLAMAPLSSNAHMILANPVPYGNPDNSPLKSGGIDYPCKNVPCTIKTMNDWKVGSTQKLSFKGTAVHGGGSCQISVTTDKEPTKASKFKVIYSIEGGCPANYPDNYPQSGPSYDGSFPFTVPPELPNGQMTMAWTWFNKIGQREMYLNCAPITVSGGATDMMAFDSLPDMAVANIANVPGADTCKTTEGKDYRFTNPGKYKTSNGIGPYVDLCTGAKSEAPAPGGGAADVSPPPSAPPAANSPAAPASPSAVPVASASATGSTFCTVSNTTSSTLPFQSHPGNDTFMPSPTSPLSTATLPTSQISIAPLPTNAISGNGTPCPVDGSVICSSDGTQFGICNFGKALMMPVAAGTKCTNGAIARREKYSHRNMRKAI